MPNQLQWDTCYSAGSDIVDEKNRSILDQCNALAECLNESNRKFDEMLESLLARTTQHFAWEEALLELGDSPELEELRCEQEEFNFLTSEILTTENFDRAELQTFLTLWWNGHIIGAANKFRALFERRLAATSVT
ncbi:MAG: hemerythrin [Pseudomonadota bacterium]|jgi:hemerythrin-like metal-binding protein|nr:hemerythrin [Pseudomonadota bacterium]MDQ5905041.1 hemerythrin [Pseudomonadota bacterium]MDQ5917214.1 hemerythrin [Pseudomonadota bacterium]MDQ5945072.1 hemerythrin [Pseudomonadota bacterium]MDQ5960190.1 hemerythrin [Pseudomonadota bacterium]